VVSRGLCRLILKVGLNVLRLFFSRWLSVSCGSILGPLLFSLYINDISVNLGYCLHHLSADDCQIYFLFGPGDGEVGVRLINEVI
jgi:hypothetical protein